MRKDSKGARLLVDKVVIIACGVKLLRQEISSKFPDSPLQLFES